MQVSMKPYFASRRQYMAQAMRVARARQLMAALRSGQFPVDPCVKCRYRGMCDNDDCAMHNFDLDVSVSPLNRH